MVRTSRPLSVTLTSFWLFAIAGRQPDASVPLPGTAMVRFGKRGRMLVYAAGDIVSGYSTAKRRWYWPFQSWGWEQYEIKHVLWALRQYNPQQQQQQGPGQQGTAAAAAAAGPLMVDVGANIAAFMFHAAAAGARVAAFEGGQLGITDRRVCDSCHVVMLLCARCCHGQGTQRCYLVQIQPPLTTTQCSACSCKWHLPKSMLLLCHVLCCTVLWPL
jgi:hypothetical protein